MTVEQVLADRPVLHPVARAVRGVVASFVAGGEGEQPPFVPAEANVWAPFDAVVDDNPVNAAANTTALIADNSGTYPWTGVKAENVNALSGDGVIYTITATQFTIDTGEANVPGVDNSRVGVVRFDPVGYQGDIYLQVGSAEGTNRNIVPADCFIQFWAYQDEDWTQYQGRPFKFLYPTNNTWPSVNKMWRIDVYDGWGTNPLKFTLRDQETGVLYNPNDPQGYTGIGYQNLSEANGINRGVWSLVKMRIKTTHATNDNRFEVWRRTYGTLTWTKVAEYVSSDTPANRLPDQDFTWTIPAGEVGGHGGLRLITTFPASNDEPIGSKKLYLKDFSITDAEAKLPVYTDY